MRRSRWDAVGYPLWLENRNCGWTAHSAFIRRSRVTLAMMDAAEMHSSFASPFTIASELNLVFLGVALPSINANTREAAVFRRAEACPGVVWQSPSMSASVQIPQLSCVFTPFTNMSTHLAIPSKVACRMLRESMCPAETTATVYCSPFTSTSCAYTSSRFDSFVIFLLSVTTFFSASGSSSGRRHADTTTGPAKGPRPASSTPTTTALFPFTASRKICSSLTRVGPVFSQPACTSTAGFAAFFAAAGFAAAFLAAGFGAAFLAAGFAAFLTTADFAVFFAAGFASFVVATGFAAVFVAGFFAAVARTIWPSLHALVS
eukprot:Rhum_TRINITY_DN10011_c0_g1::Rhum_TRINITY_DN10011_c0_g1_i1::g.36422::m.36422